MAVPVELANALVEALEHRDHLAWVLWAWGVLVAAGEGSGDLRDRAGVEDVVGLAAVARSITEFALILGDTPGVDVAGPDLLGRDEPWVTELELGRYCERHDVDTGVRPESAHALLELAVAEQEPATRAALRRVLGESVLFTSMRQIVEPNRVLPAGEGDDEEVTGALRHPRWAQGDDGLVRTTWQPDFSHVDASINADLGHVHHAAFEWLLHD